MIRIRKFWEEFETKHHRWVMACAITLVLLIIASICGVAVGFLALSSWITGDSYFGNVMILLTLMVIDTVTQPSPTAGQMVGRIFAYLCQVPWVLRYLGWWT